MKHPYHHLQIYRRNGKQRVYFRQGNRKVRLWAAMGTREFQEEYETAKSQILNGQPIERPIAKTDQPRSGSFGHLVVEYLKLPEFNNLHAKTKYDRRLHLKHILNQRASSDPTDQGYNFFYRDYTAAKMEPRHFYVLRNRKGATNPQTANLWMTTCREVFKYGIERELAGLKQNSVNPMLHIPPHPYKSGGGWKEWAKEDEEKFVRRWPLGTRQYLAYLILRRLGVRRGDAYRLGPDNIKNGELHFTQEKNEGRKPVPMILQMDEELIEALKQTPHGKTFVLSDRGKPFRNKVSFGHWFSRACKEAGIMEQKKRAHGLRKSTAAEYFDAGAGAEGLMSTFGWTELKTASIYIRARNQRMNHIEAQKKVIQKRKERP